METGSYESVQHGEAWLTIHKGQNLNNSHDFKNNQEKIAGK